MGFDEAKEIYWQNLSVFISVRDARQGLAAHHLRTGAASGNCEFIAPLPEKTVLFPSPGQHDFATNLLGKRTGFIIVIS